MTVAQRKEIGSCARILRRMFPGHVSCAEVKTMNYKDGSTKTEYAVYLVHPLTGPRHYYGETIFDALNDCLDEVCLEEENND